MKLRIDRDDVGKAERKKERMKNCSSRRQHRHIPTHTHTHAHKHSLKRENCTLLFQPSFCGRGRHIEQGGFLSFTSNYYNTDKNTLLASQHKTKINKQLKPGYIISGWQSQSCHLSVRSKHQTKTWESFVTRVSQELFLNSWTSCSLVSDEGRSRTW